MKCKVAIAAPYVQAAPMEEGYVIPVPFLNSDLPLLCGHAPYIRDHYYVWVVFREKDFIT